MDSSTGGSSSGGSLSGLVQTSGSQENLQQVMDQRKRKRMISNRESARRSRMRKQKHLDDLMTQIAQLRKQNSEIINNISVTTQHYLHFDAENSILTAQAAELSHRLESLNEIVQFINATKANSGAEFLAPDWNFPASNYLISQPIMACADMFQ
ncbi:hypothetical protein Leryth_018771 [Lithospermum erythrorhizon]|nr:hypothetical protein Leryth_018771 [Lithospermum erythrorhizon]